jgi:hypothetical protein
VVIVPSYDIVNEEFLRTKFDEITKKRLEDGFNWDKLYMDYWERLVLSKAGKRPEDRRGSRWRPQQPFLESIKLMKPMLNNKIHPLKRINDTKNQ